MIDAVRGARSGVTGRWALCPRDSTDIAGGATVIVSGDFPRFPASLASSRGGHLCFASVDAHLGKASRERGVSKICFSKSSILVVSRRDAIGHHARIYPAIRSLRQSIAASRKDFASPRKNSCRCGKRHGELCFKPSGRAPVTARPLFHCLEHLGRARLSRGFPTVRTKRTNRRRLG